MESLHQSRGEIMESLHQSRGANQTAERSSCCPTLFGVMVVAAGIFLVLAAYQVLPSGVNAISSLGAGGYALGYTVLGVGLLSFMICCCCCGRRRSHQTRLEELNREIENLQAGRDQLLQHESDDLHKIAETRARLLELQQKNNATEQRQYIGSHPSISKRRGGSQQTIDQHSGTLTVRKPKAVAATKPTERQKQEERARLEDQAVLNSELPIVEDSNPKVSTEKKRSELLQRWLRLSKANPHADLSALEQEMIAAGWNRGVIEGLKKQNQPDKTPLQKAEEMRDALNREIDRRNREIAQQVHAQNQNQFDYRMTTLIDQLKQMKGKDPSADCSAIEKQLLEMGLSQKEINAQWMSPASGSLDSNRRLAERRAVSLDSAVKGESNSNEEDEPRIYEVTDDNAGTPKPQQATSMLTEVLQKSNQRKKEIDQKMSEFAEQARLHEQNPNAKLVALIDKWREIKHKDINADCSDIEKELLPLGWSKENLLKLIKS